MFFGLTNSPATFQGFMNLILKDLIDEGYVIIYLDNVTGLGKLANQRLPVHRIIRPAIQVLGHKKKAIGNSPLFFNFTAIHKC